MNFSVFGIVIFVALIGIVLFVAERGRRQAIKEGISRSQRTYYEKAGVVLGTLLLIGGCIAVIGFLGIEPVQSRYSGGQYTREYSPYMASRLQSFVMAGGFAAVVGALLLFFCLRKK